MNFLSKLKFFLRKPGVIIVTGQGSTSGREAIFQVLNQYPQTRKKVWLSESDFKNPVDIKEFKFISGKSSLFILVVTRTGDISSDKDSFSGEKEIAGRIEKLAKTMPPQAKLVLNFDDVALREMVTNLNLKTVTFGFQSGADFQASDINQNGGTNFKINHKENIVPVWLARQNFAEQNLGGLEGICAKEQIYSALAAVCVGTILDLNLIEISQALKNYRF